MRCPHLFIAHLALSALALAQGWADRFSAEHVDHGLPRPDVRWAPYHQDPEHPCNQVWLAMYVVECVPQEVAVALPREHGKPADFFVDGWYFQKREGRAADRRWFGGDGRQMPVEMFDEEGSRRLAQQLSAIDGVVLAELKSRPRSAVWFQHDLFRLLRRLADTKSNAELRQPLLACAHRVALSAEVLRSPVLRTVGAAEVLAALPDLEALSVDKMVEVERRSSRLFDAEWVQLWSSVHVHFPDRSREELAAWLGMGKMRDPVPVGAVALLTQGIVAVADSGEAVATDLVIEARTQRLANRDPLDANNPTTTRDGVQFGMWSLARKAVRDVDASSRSVPFVAFREVDMEQQELFRDYGTRKHTTYAAQCALCHRRTGGPDEALAGFSALRATSRPRQVRDADERRQRAEVEMARFLSAMTAMAER
jgi:hypothetical protein